MSVSVTAAVYHAVVQTLASTVPLLAQRMLAPCALAEAEYVLAKVRIVANMQITVMC